MESDTRLKHSRRAGSFLQNDWLTKNSARSRKKVIFLAGNTKFISFHKIWSLFLPPQYIYDGNKAITLRRKNHHERINEY
jgi:hypothetical protein